MGLILDSSVLIASERGLFQFDAFAESVGDEEMFIAAITASELLHGVERAATPTIKKMRRQLVEQWLGLFTVLDFDLETARHHAVIWAELAKAGLPIGPHDLQIAATARFHDFALATLNTKEFARVPGLNLAIMAPFAVTTTKRKGL